MKLDFRNNHMYQVREEIIEDGLANLEDAIAESKKLMADNSLIEELEHIYSEENEKKYYGNPVHYKISASNMEAALDIAKLLAQALKVNNRLAGSRVNRVYEIKAGCYDEDDFQNMFENAQGNIVLFDLSGSEEEHAIGVPSFNTQFMSILSQKIGIDSFEDVVKAICLSYGTDVWIGNAQTLLREERYTKDSILSSREDIFDCMIALGFDREEAFVIAEFVRRGKAAVGHSEKWNDWKVKIEEAGAPDWFIWSCERIRYMFPRAHAYRYALDAWWCAWFKLYYPKEFYEAYFEICASKKLLDVVKEGSEALSLYKKGFYDHVDRIPLEYTEYDEYYTTDFVDTEILLAEEIIARGVVFN